MIFGRVIRMGKFLRWGVIAAGLFLSSAAADPSGEAFSADAVKAAYLVNFIRFTEWPASAAGNDDSPFVIGVAGNRDLEDCLWKITDGKLLQGRKVRVLRLATPADVETCRVIFINPAPARSDLISVSTAEWLKAVHGKPILTISNEPGFLETGGIINFYIDGKNLRFEISPQAADSSRLLLSSRLLALARIVRISPATPSSKP